MIIYQQQVSSGVSQLDQILGGLFIGDNVVLYDNVGTLASVFCLNFIQVSKENNKPIIYVNFDHSIKQLLEKLDSLAQNETLYILDCFTYGKGGGSDVFTCFYNHMIHEHTCQIIRVNDPYRADHVMEILYDIHSKLHGDVRFVFDSLTGMQELWNQEDQILKFYSQACPRLYELHTIAYWIIEKEAHSSQLRAHINKIAQVAIELSLKRGKTTLTILKADKRNIEMLNKPFAYRNKNLQIFFDIETRSTTGIDLGSRIKEFRMRRGISQTELAKSIGVTASNISQIENNLIYPSLPALMKISEILSVDICSFFKDQQEKTSRLVYSGTDRLDVPLNHISGNSIYAKRLIPVDVESSAEPYLIEILPNTSIRSHFFMHKGEELGFVISGSVEMYINNMMYAISSGDVIHLKSHIPTQWKNTQQDTAVLLWLKLT